MDKIKMPGQRPHFGNGKFKMLSGLKSDVEYQAAAWLQFKTARDPEGKPLPQSAEQRKAIANLMAALREAAVTHGDNCQMQLGMSIKEKAGPGDPWTVIERPLLFLDVPEEMRNQSYADTPPEWDKENDNSGNDDKPNW